MIPANGVLEFVEFCDVMAEWLTTDQNEELRLCFKVSSKKKILVTKNIHILQLSVLQLSLKLTIK